MTTTVVQELQNASHRNQAFVGFGPDPKVTCAELDPQEYYRRNQWSYDRSPSRFT